MIMLNINSTLHMNLIVEGYLMSIILTYDFPSFELSIADIRTWEVAIGKSLPPCKLEGTREFS